MRKPLCVSICLATAIGFSSLAMAATGAQTSTATPPSSSVPMQHGHGNSHHMHHRHGMGVLDKLDLTDTQRANVRKMTHESFEQARPAMQALRKQREAFASTTPGSSGYQGAANELATAEASAAHDRVTREAALRARIYDVLTPKQRTELATLRAQHKTRMHQWRSEHMHHSSATPAPASSTR